MNRLPDLTTDELCDLYPQVAETIRWYIHEPRLMPDERILCLNCDTAYETINNRKSQSCSPECGNTLERRRYNQ